MREGKKSPTRGDEKRETDSCANRNVDRRVLLGQWVQTGLAALLLGSFSGCRQRHQENLNKLQQGPAKSLSRGLKGEALKTWNQETKKIIELQRAEGIAIRADGLQGLAEVLLDSPGTYQQFFVFTRQVARYGGTEARDILLSVLKQDCGASNRWSDDFENYNHRFNLAKDVADGLTWLLLGDTLSVPEKQSLYNEMKNLSTSPVLSEPTKRGIERSLYEFHYGVEGEQSLL